MMASSRTVGDYDGSVTENQAPRAPAPTLSTGDGDAKYAYFMPLLTSSSATMAPCSPPPPSLQNDERASLDHTTSLNDAAARDTLTHHNMADSPGFKAWEHAHRNQEVSSQDREQLAESEQQETGDPTQRMIGQTSTLERTIMNRSLSMVDMPLTIADVHDTLSPPTVSPLSTPAVTAAPATPADNRLQDDDFWKLSDENGTTETGSGPDPDAGPVSGATFASPRRQAVELDWEQEAALSAALSAPASVQSHIPMPKKLKSSHHRHSRTLSPCGTAGFSADQNAAIATTDADVPQFSQSLSRHATGTHTGSHTSPSTSTVNPHNVDTRLSLGGVHPGEPSSHESDNGSGLMCYASLEFEDGTFQVPSECVVIGRDMRAMRQAERDELSYAQACQEAESRGQAPPPQPHRQNGYRPLDNSYVSPSGGIVGPAEELEGNTGREYIQLSEGSTLRHLSTLKENPQEEVFVGIHGSQPNIYQKTKNISRRHLKIIFNREKGVWEAKSLAKNGFFLNEEHYKLNHKTCILRCGDDMQIGSVCFTFVIPDVEVGMTGGEMEGHDNESGRQSRVVIGGKEMSFDFESPENGILMDTEDDDLPDHSRRLSPDSSPLSSARSSPAPPVISTEETRAKTSRVSHHPEQPPQARSPLIPPPEPDSDEDGMRQLAAAVAAESENSGNDIAMNHPASQSGALPTINGSSLVPPQQSAPAVPSGPPVDPTDPLVAVVQKRRGPGRPPKDGIMSKRERKELEKARKLEEAKVAPPMEPPGDRIRRPVGRPKKTAEEGDKLLKRPYAKRKREDGEEGSEGEEKAKAKNPKRVRAKSPPLLLCREDYTEDQLQKPQKSYAHLIEEVLLEATVEGLPLKSIYKNIIRKYPFYYFNVETKGWESSVRHNLIGNSCFQKNEETSFWTRLPDIDLEVGKKKAQERQGGLSAGPPGQSPMSQSQSYYPGGHGQHQHAGTPYIPAPGLLDSTYPGNIHTPGSQHPTMAQNSTVQHPHQGQHHYLSPSLHPPHPANDTARNPADHHSRLSTSHAHGTIPGQLGQPKHVVGNGVSQHDPSGAVPTATNGLVMDPIVHKHPDRPGISKALNEDLNSFKEKLLPILAQKLQSSEMAANFIESCISRSLGIQTPPVHKNLESLEQFNVLTINNILRGHNFSLNGTPASASAATKEATPSSKPRPPSQSPSMKREKAPTPAPEAPPAQTEAQKQCDADFKARLRVFRDNIIKSIEAKCQGRSDAADIVDSPINRALGLPSSGPPPDFKDFDSLLFSTVQKMTQDLEKKFGVLPSCVRRPAAHNKESTATEARAQKPAQPAQPATTAAAHASTAAESRSTEGAGSVVIKTEPSTADARSSLLSASARGDKKPTSSTGHAGSRHGISIPRPAYRAPDVGSMGYISSEMSNSVRPPPAPPPSLPSLSPAVSQAKPAGAAASVPSVPVVAPTTSTSPTSFSQAKSTDATASVASSSAPIQAPAAATPNSPASHQNIKAEPDATELVPAKEASANGVVDGPSQQDGNPLDPSRALPSISQEIPPRVPPKMEATSS